MGFLVRMGLLAGAGAVIYKMFRRDGDASGDSEAAPVYSSGVVRNAGREEQQDANDNRPWDMVDEQADESFPASDPPGNY
ncbi:MAG: hypothetical protein AB7E05_07015 [Sphingobium sp.]